MTARRTRLVVAGFAALSVSALALPAHAADDSTTVTFTLAAGVLAIDAPTAVDLGSVGGAATVASISGKLGNTQVTDNRGGLLSAYAVSLSSSNFTTGAAGPNETILGSTVTAMSGPVSHTNTSATAVEVETLVPVPGGTTITSLSAYNGNDEANYDPEVTIPIPVTNAAGQYTGTITQTVLAV